MPDKQNDTTAENAQPVDQQRVPWPPLPEPFDVPHVTMSGGLFGGLDVMRTEYIKPRPPRRGLLRRPRRSS